MPTPNSALNTTDRRALAAVAVQFFVNGALPASFIPRLPEIRDQVGIGIATGGLLVSLAGMTGLLSSAAVGPAIERFGTRRVILGAGAVIPLSLAVIGVARTPAVLLVGLIGMMAFDVLVDVPMNMQASPARTCALWRPSSFIWGRWALPPDSNWFTILCWA